MDTYRGNFIDRDENGEDFASFDLGEDEAVSEPPPSPIGQDERRMQVRAYNHWASLLDNRNFPSIEDLDPYSLPDFGPYSVLLDFTGGIEDPSIQYLGDKLAEECSAASEIESLSDVPSRSLLSRITDHYMQILANQAPIGFEAEFVNQREKTILYRGILLPFSSDDDTIDFIYGVINWKELADQHTTDELLQQIDSALEIPGDLRRDDPLTEWADGPSAASGEDLDEIVHDPAPEPGSDEDEDVLDLAIEAVETGADDAGDAVLELSTAAPGEESHDDVLDLADLVELAGADEFAAVHSVAEEFAILELTREDEDGMGLADWLASARELAEAARGSEDRTRHALYAAIGKAYDFSLAAAEAPGEFAELVADSGLTVQERAPLIPVVKLVFGADYDKTRLTEYASALGHAHRLSLVRGALADHLTHAAGGLKGVVAEERRLRREESGKPATVRDTPRQALARKLRKLEHFPLDAVAADGAEFTLLVARRLPEGEVVLLGEVADDVPLLERVAKKLIA